MRQALGMHDQRLEEAECVQALHATQLKMQLAELRSAQAKLRELRDELKLELCDLDSIHGEHAIELSKVCLQYDEQKAELAQTRLQLRKLEEAWQASGQPTAGAAALPKDKPTARQTSRDQPAPPEWYMHHVRAIALLLARHLPECCLLMASFMILVVLLISSLPGRQTVPPVTIVRMPPPYGSELIARGLAQLWDEYVLYPFGHSRNRV